MLSPAAAAPQLASYVSSYVQIRADFRDAVLFWPIPARSFTCIEFTFGNPYHIEHVTGHPRERTHPSTLIGAKTYQRIGLELHGSIETFAVLFQPTGLQRLFSLPGVQIVNNHYEAEAVLGSGMTSLRSRLKIAKSFLERIRIADEYFTGRLTTSKPSTAESRTAQEIISRQGCVRVQDLADKTGRSLRQFERRFAEEVGMTPKLYARIARFEAAVRKRMTSPKTSWTDIAHELHYHDHMHMIHDFHLLSGGSPTSLVMQLEDLVSSVADRQV